MLRKEIIATRGLSTSLPQEKVERIADECGVGLTLLDTRLHSRRIWMNDFEVEGESGKVEAFFVKVKDVEK